MTVEQMTLETWRETWKKRGGPAARFRCPACDHIASGADFVALGGTPSDAPVECLGRVMTPRAEGPDRTLRPGGPCNWAAYGLFGVLDAGVEVTAPDGSVMRAFPFAD